MASAAGGSAEGQYRQNRVNLETLIKTGYLGEVSDDVREAFLKELASNDQLGRGTDEWNFDSNDLTKDFVNRFASTKGEEERKKQAAKQRIDEIVKLRNETPGLAAQTILGSGSVPVAGTILGGGSR